MVILLTVVLVGRAGVILSRQDGSHGFSLRTKPLIVQCHAINQLNTIVRNGLLRTGSNIRKERGMVRLSLALSKSLSRPRIKVVRTYVSIVHSAGVRMEVQCVTV